MSSAEIINYFTIILSVLFFFIFKFFNLKISNYFNLIDRPNKRKIHKRKTPLTAGFAIVFTLIFCHLIYLVIYGLISEVLLILIGFSISFIIGLIDDKKNLSYKLKFFLFIILILIIINSSNNLILINLNFETFNKSFGLNIFQSNIITLLCLLLLINATNLSDGINGLCLGILIIWMLYINYKLNLYLNLYPIIIVSILTFIYIYRGFYFLGNSGSHALGIFIGLIIIYSYNYNYSNEFRKEPVTVEEIFILLMLPGIDMLRLFILRLLKKRNPFSSDLSHFHHYLIKRYKLKYSLTIYFSMMIIPILVYNLTVIRPLNIIIIFIIFYSLLIYFFSKKVT